LVYAGGMKKFIDYLRAAVIPRSPVSDEATALLTRTFRWWLEFARNLLVVASFFFIAQASNILVLKIFAVLNILALFGMVCMFFFSWYLRPFPYIKSPRLYRVTNEVLWGIIFAVMVFGSAYAFVEVIKALKVIVKV
jgi:hypothetical protein